MQNQKNQKIDGLNLDQIIFWVQLPPVPARLITVYHNMQNQQNLMKKS